VTGRTGLSIARSSAQAIGRAVGNLAWSAVRASARDVTSQMAGARLLVLAPHPDDETLACGGCIARAVAAGDEVHVVVVTDGRHGRWDQAPDTTASIRLQELARAVAQLGLAPDQVHSLGRSDGSLATQIDELRDQIGELIRDHRPTVLVSPWAYDTHADHAALGEAARAAGADYDLAILGYVVWAWTQPLHLVRDRLRRSGRPTGMPGRGSGWGRTRWPVRVDTGPYLGPKTRALSSHVSQLGPTADQVGLPTGSGPLEARFLRRFLGRSEVFLPCGRAELSPGGSGCR
jgi:LmbE family N-acetylglucosaminyl deacetylase